MLSYLPPTSRVYDSCLPPPFLPTSGSSQLVSVFFFSFHSRTIFQPETVHIHYFRLLSRHAAFFGTFLEKQLHRISTAISCSMMQWSRVVPTQSINRGTFLEKYLHCTSMTISCGKMQRSRVFMVSSID